MFKDSSEYWRVVLSKSFDVVEFTREELNDLGFYYDYDEETKVWIIEGTRKGLIGFAQILKDYATKTRNEKLGEHDHLGPYMYLTIVTAELPRITDYGILVR